MGLPTLNINDIQDEKVRKNFENLMTFLRKESPLLGFRFFSVTFQGAVANYKYPHNMGFQPKDIVVTSQIGSGSVSFNYGNFDATNLDLTATGPVTVRFFAGTYLTSPT